MSLLNDRDENLAQDSTQAEEAQVEEQVEESLEEAEEAKAPETPEAEEAQAVETSETEETNATVRSEKEERRRLKQLKAEEKARAKELKRREKEIAKAEKRLSREKAIIDAQASFQKKKAEKHRQDEEEEALRLIKSLTDDVESFDPVSIGMAPELHKRAVALERKRVKEEKARKLQEYKKQRARRNGTRFSGPGAEKANKMKFLHFLNLSDKLRAECEEEYPISRLAIHVLVAFTIITLAGHLIFELSFLSILICCITYFLCAPSLIYFSHRKKYESARFRDCSRYIEQMIFSFTRRQNLLTALEETRLVLDGTIGDAIDYAIDVLRHRAGEEDIYKVALRKIEEFFPSLRVRNLHEFLVAVESDGGRHETTMKILLDDVREWDVRTNEFKQNQAVKGVSLLISILMSIGVCWFMTNILPDDLGGDISGNVVYQIATTLMLVVMFLMYMFGNRKLTRSWVADNRLPDESRIEADRAAIDAYYENPQGKIKPVLAIYRMQTEVEKVFPRWILHFALLSSAHPIPVALSMSVSKAPFAIKADLEKMVAAIDKNPAAIQPYLEFCRHYDLPQVHSMMMMIYSLSEYGLADADQQVLSLVKRNNSLQANAEKIENDEQLARFSLYTIIPMILGSGVMLVDVVLMILNMVENIL